MIRNDPKCYVFFCILIEAMAAALLDMFDDGEEKIVLEVRELALNDGGDSIETGAGVNVFPCQWLEPETVLWSH